MAEPQGTREEGATTEGYQQALALMHRCATTDGFLASPTERANYHRVWSRDGAVLGLAALASGDEALVTTLRATLETLARYQGPHGEIPSNVEPTTERVSFGGTAGRVDASLWFVIACGEYWAATGDDAFIEAMLPTLERVRFLLGAWEFNNRGLLYIPQTGDWADEYVQSGYVLYDQLLYLQALRTLCRIHAHVHGSADHTMLERTGRLYHLIRANYWFRNGDYAGEDAYHPVLYQRGKEAAALRKDGHRYWMPFFSPTGYGFRFDAFANVLASLLQVAYDNQRAEVDAYIRELAPAGMELLPAFHPVIQPDDSAWQELQTNFSYSFRNHPYEYHNGGLWPLITGFYVADLAGRDPAAARHHLAALDRANALPMGGEPWGFPEFVHGTELTAGGTRHQGWSAAAAVIGHRAITGTPLLRLTGGPDDG